MKVLRASEFDKKYFDLREPVEIDGKSYDPNRDLQAYYRFNNSELTQSNLAFLTTDPNSTPGTRYFYSSSILGSAVYESHTSASLKVCEGPFATYLDSKAWGMQTGSFAFRTIAADKSNWRVSSGESLGYGPSQQFSVALWMRHSTYSRDGVDLGGTGPLVMKIRPTETSANNKPWSLQYNETATQWYFYFRIRDIPNGQNLVTQSTYVTDIGSSPAKLAGVEPGEWVHVVHTWDGTNAANSRKFYINGKDQTRTSTTNASFSSMEGDMGDILIARAEDDTTAPAADWSTFDLAEVAIFRRELNLTEIQVIYAAQKEGFNLDRNTSGIISNTPRNQLVQWDNDFDTYPTNKFSTDQRLLGTRSVHFDDTWTRVFTQENSDFGSPATTASTIRMPTLTPPKDYINSPFSSSFLTPNEPPEITIEGWRPKMIYGNYKFPTASVVNFSDPYVPYNDSRIYLDTTSFFMTGSEMLPGLAASLRDKVALSIDLTCDKTTALSASGHLYGNFAMGYYNFSRKTFEGLGQGKGNFNGAGSYMSMSQRYCDEIFFGTLNEPGYKNRPFDYGGAPQNTFGFPYHPKFVATSSQIYKASNLINEPFAVERAIYIFSSSLTSSGCNLTNNARASSTFMLLNQREGFNLTIDETRQKLDQRQAATGKASTNPNTFFTCSIPSRTIIGSGSATNGATYEVTSTRELITWGIVRSVSNTIQQSLMNQIPNSWDILIYDSANALVSYSARSLLLQMTASNPAGYPNLQERTGFYSNAASAQEYFQLSQGWPEATRTGLSISSGRGLLGEQTKIYTSGSILRGHEQTTFLGYKPGFNQDLKTPNPYVLFPEDNLVFCWHSPSHKAMQSGIPWAGKNDNKLEIFGNGKLVLFGSYLRNREAIDTTSRQELVTNTIHRTIGNDPVLDQYETVPRNALSGSSRERIMSGAITRPFSGVSRTGQPIQDGYPKSEGYFRRVIATIISQPFITIGRDDNNEFGGTFNAGRKSSDLGSISNWRGYDFSEFYYDSFGPDPVKCWEKDGISVTLPTALFIGSKSHPQYAGQATLNPEWLRSFPFEPRYLKDTFGNDISRFPTVANGIKEVIYNISDRFVGNPRMYYARNRIDSYSVGQRYFVQGDKMITSAVLFGFGDGPSGSLDGQADGTVFTAYKPRGWKYGMINGQGMGTSAVYRSSQYGQFADRLEQRQYSRLFNIQAGPGLSALAPVEIVFRVPVHEDPNSTQFFLNPADTQSCNLSIFATSSLPYFDGYYDPQTGKQPWVRSRGALPTQEIGILD